MILCRNYILVRCEDMKQTKEELIEADRAVCGDFPLQDEFSACGVAIRMADGHIFIVICIDLASGLELCAEVAAMAEMLKHRETHIDTVMAVSGQRILPPSSRCRETMAQIDPRNMESI